MMVQININHNCINGAGTSCEGVAHGRGWCKIVNKRLHQNLSDVSVKFRVGTLNVGTMRGRSGEVVETLSRRHIDLWLCSGN